MRRALLILLALLPLAASARAAQAPDTGGDPFALGVEAYRAGDHASATSLWLRALETARAPEDRARVLYDLGNAAWRAGDRIAAIAWYTACVRVAPRHADAWANLEYARAEASLEPADRGDLGSTLRRLVTSLTAAESARLLLAALLLLAVPLAGEALRGGRAWRWASVAGALVVLVCAVPWAWHGTDRFAPGGADPVMVVADAPLALRSEPRADLPSLTAVQPATILERLDALPGWIRVETEDGLRGWLPESALQSLDP